MTHRYPLRVLLALVASMLGAASARAQQPVFAANAMTSLDSTTQAALTRELGQARARGLPVEPLVSKVREGLLKRARPDRIHSAVVVLAGRLDSARSALGVASNTAELVAGADALGAGADVAALRAVRTASGARDVAAPLGALAQLVATGVPKKRATQMIVDLLHREVPAGQVLAFGVAVETDVGSGVPAIESATFRMREIEATIGSGDRVTSAAAPPGDWSITQGMGALGGGKNVKPKRRP
ncbi:MAG TPA: hypothetical protein VGP25_11450 [Gemmatimonadaceae bacterium]|nr:hypothetical protein [Gemmatimonadaceae bacterium]